MQGYKRALGLLYALALGFLGLVYFSMSSDSVTVFNMFRDQLARFNVVSGPNSNRTLSLNIISDNNNTILLDSRDIYDNVVCHYMKLLNISRTRFVHQIDQISVPNDTHYVHVASEHPRTGKSHLYLPTIAKFAHIQTIAVRWQPQTFVNELPIFYDAPWPPELCKLSNIQLNAQCARNLNQSMISSATLSPSSVLSQYLPTNSSLHHYIHIIPAAIVTNVGMVFSKGLAILPFQCKYGNIKVAPSISKSVKQYDEVFSIAQYWGGGYFHASIEDTPRLGPFVDFLIEHPHIRIHAAGAILKKHLQVLGLKNELVYGAVKAKLLYLPPGGGCGWLRPFASRGLTKKFHDHIRTHFTEEETQPRNVVVLIHRSSRRWLHQSQHADIKAHLQNVTAAAKMVFWEFKDKPLPSYEDTLKMFYRAKLIIAPHGAGLSNALFSQAGSTVVEVLCNPQPNGCYKAVALALGHRYIGLLSERGPCGAMKIDLVYFKKVIASVLSTE